MRAGRLDRRIDIQRNIPTLSDSGEPVESWSSLAANLPAIYRGLKVDERLTGGPQVIAQDQVEFTVRYSSSLLDLNPKDRILYPSMAADSPAAPIPSSRIYNVLGIVEVGRREALLITALRAPDAAP